MVILNFYVESLNFFKLNLYYEVALSSVLQ